MEKACLPSAAAVLFFGLCRLSFADVNLTGTLVNEINIPITTQCNCALKRAALSAKSNVVDGTFLISAVKTVVPFAMENFSNPAYISGRTLYFCSVSENEPVLIEIFDASGKSESLVLNNKLPAGRYSVNPLAYLETRASNSIRFVRIRCGARTATLTLLPFATFASHAAMQKGVSLVALARQATVSSAAKQRSASSAVVDTLDVTCGGTYPEVKVPVVNYIGDMGLVTIPTKAAGGKVMSDTVNKTISLSDDKNRIQLRFSYNGKSLLDDVRILGSQNIVSPTTGVCTAIETGGQWFTTRSGITTPTVTVSGNVVTFGNIQYGGGGETVTEKWILTTHPDCISWTINRKYQNAATLDDTYFPGWDFDSMTTWSGALLDDGGVAWCKFLETTNATLGAHAGEITLWNRQTNSCLRVVPTISNNSYISCRFSHQPSNMFTYCQSITPVELAPKYNLSRYLAGSQDVWKSFPVKAGDSASVSFDLWPLSYDTAYDRGTLVGVNESSVREMMHTIARYGVIDKKHFGGNGWRSGYICLHEQWWPHIAIALDEADYTKGLMESYDYYRDRAVGTDGRVKSRFKDTPGDNMAGTYDTAGFYEAQWGYLMDSQTDYVMVVAEHFQITGDITWATGQKATCEKVLAYLLNRDTNANGLFEMRNNNHTEGTSSDWIDIIWASFENGLVNAEMYSALTEWADVEDVLADTAKATTYRAAAVKLKATFNKTTDQGGLWDANNKCYVYWRDKDNSVHGNNLVMPVNICAIAYGICDDTSRISAILSQMETKMQDENLFVWPLCFNSFATGEGSSTNFPFPSYENGDIFLSWGELAVRAYAKYNPSIAMKYVKNVLARYEQDGLAYQRYLRGSQQGAGDDILSGNCMAVAGLYRDIYGIRPLYNGLYLEPHLTSELNGTRLKYMLRGKLFTIDLSVGNYAITVNGVTVRDTKPFAVDDNGNRL
jgi:hypothetical protein